MSPTPARRPKASDLTDAEIIAAVQSIKRERRGHMVSRWAVAERFPALPFKVVSAKLNTMTRRGILDGCYRGHECRGDFEVR